MFDRGQNEPKILSILAVVSVANVLDDRHVSLLHGDSYKKLLLFDAEELKTLTDIYC